MGDENMNNSEDTSALFVSGQRKQQAMEEARKKAEEEQARKALEESEILRREEEVASRKDQAETLKKKLEIKEQKRNKNKKIKKLLPVAIGAGAAVVILIGTMVWPKPKKAYEKLADFGAEYDAAETGYDITMKYPDTLFSEISENSEGDNLDISFKVSGKEDLSMDVLLSKTEYDKNTKSIKWTEINDKLKAVSQSYLNGAELQEESISDPLNVYHGKYYYKCTYTIDNKSGAYYGWCAEDESGNVYVEAVDCRAGKNDIESAVRLRDQFYDNNSEKAIDIPGSYEPEDKEYKGRLKTSCSVKMNIPVPENMFTEIENYENDQGIWQEWVDDNGAIILVGSMLYASSDNFTQLSSSDMPNLYSMYDQLIEEYLNGKVDFTERKKSGDTLNAVYVDVDSKAEYFLKVNGREYMEKDYTILLQDEFGNVYCELIYTLVPSTKNALYTELVNYSLENLTVER